MGFRIVTSISVCAALLSACAGGGMYSQPYALFEPAPFSPTGDVRPAVVMKVDSTSRDLRNNDPVSPGPHTIELSIPGPRAMGDPQRETVAIEAKPCTRYLFGARRSARSADDWSAFLAGTEPIGECQKKFPDAK
jgi:hypothetical protein